MSDLLKNKSSNNPIKKTNCLNTEDEALKYYKIYVPRETKIIQTIPLCFVDSLNFPLIRLIFKLMHYKWKDSKDQ